MSDPSALAAAPWAPAAGADLTARHLRVRAASERLAAPISAEDGMLQSMPDASPTRWHLAHTTWFFENFVLAPAGVAPAHPQWAALFNSYYRGLGEPFPRADRGRISRPGRDEVRAWRAEVDRRVLDLLARGPGAQVLSAIELGLQHEQQHQELILTDILHAFSLSPLAPRYASATPAPAAPAAPLEWLAHPGGLVEIGHAGAGFAYDNEAPRHRAFVEPFELASRLVTNGEYLAFVEDGGYRRHDLWLSLGWDRVRAEGWSAPLYWRRNDGRIETFSLHGARPLDPHEPVAHLSLFEADAYATWAGARLPTEAEWEAVAAQHAVRGNLLDAEHPERSALRPRGAPGGEGTRQLFGDVWEWTSSAYSPYPGYRRWEGVVGEYNGKFMCNQYVLRGGSYATPADHVRATYRNFFPPEARWQASGIRLARTP